MSPLNILIETTIYVIGTSTPYQRTEDKAAVKSSTTLNGRGQSRYRVIEGMKASSQSVAVIVHEFVVGRGEDLESFFHGVL